MVKFGRLVFNVFGRQVKYLAVWFSIYSAVGVRPCGQVQNLVQKSPHRKKNLATLTVNSRHLFPLN